MHKKYAKDGLVIVTVSLDSVEDKEARARALKFLRGKEATFTNLLLDEPGEFWQEKLRFAAPPCYYVFNRQAKWTQFNSDDGPINYQNMEKLIVELLKEK